MYNGIGLPTARGSGTNGYIQSNRFSARTKVARVLTDPSSIKGFESGQGTAGVTRKANKEILEHDRKRQIEVKLLELEEKLTDQGYTDVEVAEKLQEVRLSLQAQAAAEDDGGAAAGAIDFTDKRVSDTQTHQIAARKEKQMEKFRAALGIGAEVQNQKKLTDGAASDSEDIDVDDNPSRSHKKDASGIKKHRKDAVEEKENDDARKSCKDKRIEVGRDELDEPRRHKKKESRRTHDGESSETDSDRKYAEVSKKNHKRRGYSSESEDESDDDVRKRKQKSSVKQKKSRRHDSDYSSSESDSESSSDDERDKKYRKSVKRHESSVEYSSGESPKSKSQKVSKPPKRGRHDSEYESSSDGQKRERRSHHEKKRIEHREGFGSRRNDRGRNDLKFSKGRRDEAGGRYESKSDSDSDRAHKTRRRLDSDKDDSSSDVEKRERISHHEKKRNEHREAFGSRKDDVGQNDQKFSKARRDKVGGRYESRSDSDSGRAHKTRRGLDSDEDESGSDREKEGRRNHSEKRNQKQSSFRPEKDDIGHYDHRVHKGRKDEIDGRHGLRKDSDSEAPKAKSKLENTRRRHDSDDEESYHDRRKIQKSRWHDSDVDNSSDSHDNSSKSDASESSDHRHKRSDHEMKSLEKNYSHRSDDLGGRGRNARERAYAREDDGNGKNRRTSQKVDDGLDTLKKLKNLYHSREEKTDSLKYKDLDPKSSKRKIDDGDEQPERKSRRMDFGREAEHGGAKNEPEEKAKRSGQDYDGRGRRDSEDDKDRSERKHRRDEEEDRKRDGDRDDRWERHRREQEEDRVNRYKRDRDVDSSKRGKYDDSHSKRRRHDDDVRYDDRRR